VFVVSTLYFSRIVKVNSKFMRFLLLFSISTILTYFVVFILNLIIPTVIAPLIANTGVSILISVVMILLASLYLMFDLEQIRQVVEGGQPKNMEWYVAFGLIYTIIWLYIQILRLVAIIMSRDR
ncbi:MAG: Bax inhibitor-1/YccA family protein, partial [Bacilli bacterium]